jgi:hypothetical protein
MYDVFLSHNRLDKPWVRQLRQVLIDAGRTVFFDEVDIPFGVDFSQAIAQALDETARVVLVLSRTSLRSKWVAAEQSMTVIDDPGGEKGQLIPVIIDPLVSLEKLDRRLRRLNVVDLARGDGREENLRNLLGQLGVANAAGVALPPWPEFPPLEVGDAATVRSWQWTFEKLLKEFIDLDYSTLGQVLAVDEGTVEQWAPIFEKRPHTWRLLYDEPQTIAGYWHFAPLIPDDFAKAVQGQLRDGDIKSGRIPDAIAGVYDVYFVQICLRPVYRMNLKILVQLFRSVFDALTELARSEVFVREVCANGYSEDGQSVCRSFGMTEVGPHVEHGIIFRAPIKLFLAHRLAKPFEELRKAYTDARLLD